MNEGGEKKKRLSSVPAFRFPPPLTAAKALKWEKSEQKLLAHVLMCLNWKKCSSSWGSAARGRNFHLCEKLFKNIWCRPDAEMECVRRVVPNTSSCKVKGLSPLQGQVICRIMAAPHTWGGDSLELNKIVHYGLFTFRRNNLILNGSHCDCSLQIY